MSKQQRLVLIISILASFVAFLDGSVVNVALPAIIREFHGGLATAQWVVDAYLITLGALMLIAGSFSDLFGRKRILQIGLVGFAAASLLCAVAPSGAFLIVSRGLQGIAGALLVPSSLALIISAFSGSAQGKAIGTWTAWTGIAFIIGPLLGGFLVDSVSWRLIFAINVLPIAVTLWLIHSLELPEHIRGTTPLDRLGATLCALGLGGVVYALIEQSRYGWSSPIIIAALAVGTASLISFMSYERRTEHPMLPLELFKVRNFGMGNAATAFIYAGLSLATFLIVIAIQQIGGYTAMQAGLALLPVTAIMFVLSPLFGKLAGQYGPRWFMTFGPIIGGLGFLYMLRTGQAMDYWLQILPGIVLFGVGLSVTVAPLTAAVLGSIDSRQAGIGSAINNAVARIAGLIAIATIGLVTGPKLTLVSFHRGIIVMAALLILGGLISAIGIENKSLKKAPQS